MKLDNMSWDETVGKCKDKIILIPHGSTEQHGYHLPLKTDALIAEKVCEIFYDSDDIVVAPVMRYTGMKTTKEMPGTVGPNPEEYEIKSFLPAGFDTANPPHIKTGSRRVHSGREFIPKVIHRPPTRSPGPQARSYGSH